MPEEKESVPVQGSMPRIVIDPDLPDHVQRAIQEAEHRDLLAPDPGSEPSPWWGLFAPFRAETVLFVMALSSLLSLSSFRRIVGPVGLDVLLCVIGGMACWSAHAVAQRRRRRTQLHQLRDMRGHYVVPEDLNESACELLARAHRAMYTVSRSTARREGVIDRQRDEQRFPFEEWEIASDLAVYSRLVREIPKKGKSELAEKKLEEQRRKLDLTRSAIEARVRSVEAYAGEVLEDDRKYAERRELREITGRDDAVLDLLAKTARHDRATAEMRHTAEETAAVSEAFDSAMRTTELAAEVPLPPSREAD